MGDRGREPRRALVPDEGLDREGFDRLRYYYPKNLVDAYRRREPGSVFALLKDLEHPPTTLTHVRTTQMVSVPSEIGYQRRSGDLLTLKMRESMEHLDEMLFIAGQFAKGGLKPEELPEVGYFYKWRVAEAPPRATPDRMLGGSYEGLSKFLVPRETGRPSFYLRRELPHIRRTFKSKLGDAGVRLEGDPRIRALDPKENIDDGEVGEEHRAIPPSRDMP